MRTRTMTVISNAILILLACLLVNTDASAQCSNHSPTEKGKNLYIDLIHRPEHRWYGTSMTYYVQNTAQYWYGNDITFAKNVWNNSSYKGTNSSFSFINGGTTNAPVAENSDDSDLLNVIGIRDLGSSTAAQARTFVFGNGEIVECDITINSIIYTHIQPHRLATGNDYCVQNALCHEFGHALGLKDLYNDRRSKASGKVEYIPDTMYWDIDRGEHKKESLECDDKWGSYWLYDSGKVPPPTAPSIIQEKPQLALQHRSELPIQTRLIRNYPNPFNPETWIPYELADDANVAISIYDSTGNAVRYINVGNQPEGRYVDKAKAVHWDGTDNNGAVVASGVYFYTLTADDFSDTQRMVILK